MFRAYLLDCFREILKNKRVHFNILLLIVSRRRIRAGAFKHTDLHTQETRTPI